MGLLPGITGAVEVGGGLLGSIFGARAQNKLQKKQWAREDNAVQRRARDLEKAGLSKTLAAGGAAQAGPAIHASSGIDQLTGIPSKLGQAGRNYVGMQQNMQQTAQTKAQTRIVEAEASLKESEAAIMKKKAMNEVYTINKEGGLEQSYQESDWTLQEQELRAKAASGELANMNARLRTIGEQFGIRLDQLKIAKEEYMQNHEGMSSVEAEYRVLMRELEDRGYDVGSKRMNYQFSKSLYDLTGGVIPPQMMDTLMQILGRFVPQMIGRYQFGKGGKYSGSLPPPGTGNYWKKTPMEVIR